MPDNRRRRKRAEPEKIRYVRAKGLALVHVVWIEQLNNRKAVGPYIHGPNAALTRPQLGPNFARKCKGVYRFSLSFASSARSICFKVQITHRSRKMLRHATDFVSGIALSSTTMSPPEYELLSSNPEYELLLTGAALPATFMLLAVQGHQTFDK
ncbi:hypothetical protein FB451DRAFT_1182867 [Mycena latifolia]|nr:hypothetical protein FB451DRAFT_1182867 [Mycena latifolia]